MNHWKILSLNCQKHTDYKLGLWSKGKREKLNRFKLFSNSKFNFTLFLTNRRLWIIIQTQRIRKIKMLFFESIIHKIIIKYPRANTTLIDE